MLRAIYRALVCLAATATLLAVAAPGVARAQGSEDWGSASVHGNQIDLAPVARVGPPLAPRSFLRQAFQEKPRIKPDPNPSWQRRYELGPGDILNFSFYERADLLREKVPIAPDGSVSYLQAVGVRAQGRTIGELRDAIEEELKEYHQDPKVIITPFKLSSKKITVLGKVRKPGVYPMERPTTILEAFALTEGIEIGAIEGAAYEIADMNHSFIVRRGRKLDVDLGRLYYEGDFSQNAYLEPGDYVYIASSLNNECYVLGSVETPGLVKLTGKMTVARAISQSGGLTKEAWKEDILVISGSIHRPQTRIVSLNDILHARAPDVPVRDGDIIYVHDRPWVVLEKVLDSALVTFTQSAVTGAIDREFETDTSVTVPAGDDGATTTTDTDTTDTDSGASE